MDHEIKAFQVDFSYYTTSTQKFTSILHNDALGNVTPFKYGYFWVCMYVSFQGGYMFVMTQGWAA